MVNRTIPKPTNMSTGQWQWLGKFSFSFKLFGCQISEIDRVSDSHSADCVEKTEINQSMRNGFYSKSKSNYKNALREPFIRVSTRRPSRTSVALLRIGAVSVTCEYDRAGRWVCSNVKRKRKNSRELDRSINQRPNSWDRWKTTTKSACWLYMIDLSRVETTEFIKIFLYFQLKFENGLNSAPTLTNWIFRNADSTSRHIPCASARSRPFVCA